MRPLVLMVLLAAACADPAPARIPRAPSGVSALEVRYRPAGKRSYRLRVQQLLAIEPRGRGLGRMHTNLDLRARLDVAYQATPADGVRMAVSFADVKASARGPRSSTVAGAARALAGAKVTVESGPRGVLRSLRVTGTAAGRALASSLSRALAQLGPALGRGLKGPGSRWGQTTTVRLPLEDGTDIPTAVTANYVFQGTGMVERQPCVLLSLTLKVTGKAPAPGKRPGAFNASGSGRGETCLDPATGALRAGRLRLTMRNAVGLRSGAGRAPLHLDQTVRLKISVDPATGGTG